MDWRPIQNWSVLQPDQATIVQPAKRAQLFSLNL